jgi:hypothetical protein
MEGSQEQTKKQFNYDKPWLYVKGQSGNPGGRPKGSKSLKTFAREYLESLTGDDKIEFLKTLPSEIVWKMSEGNPESKSETVNTHTITTLSEEDKAKLNILL